MASTFTNLLYHVVYSTKFRHPTIDPSWQPQLHAYLGGIVKDRDGVPLEIGGVADHVHLFVRLSPKWAIMDVLRDIKAVSSKWINDQRLARGKFEWQVGYGAFSVSQSQAPSVRNYVRTQEEHHRRLSYRDEFLELLRRHEIEFDLKYVFEEEHIA